MPALSVRPIAAAILVSTSTLALAQGSPVSGAPPSAGPLPTLQVTATRTEQPIGRAGSAITVIGPQEIARASARN
ncbi:MAG TPA: hypothetical protein VEA41_20875, partial [Salinarimonas sp.]|nr:hypothetical protein [Salinarimonas sp.]